MNLKALITTLVLGTSSAMAAPGRPVVVDDCNDNLPAQTYQAPVHAPVVVKPAQPVLPTVRGPYYNPTNVKVGKDASTYTGSVAKAPMTRYFSYGKAMWRPSATTWFDLTEATRIEAGREFFTIGADKGQFKSLALQALGSGRSEIKQVTIEFLDATGRAKTQVVKLNTWISPKSKPTITIDLDGNYRSISRIIVYGSTDRGSAYKLLAM